MPTRCDLALWTAVVSLLVSGCGKEQQKAIPTGSSAPVESKEIGKSKDTIDPEPSPVETPVAEKQAISPGKRIDLIISQKEPVFQPSQIVDLKGGLEVAEFSPDGHWLSVGDHVISWKDQRLTRELKLVVKSPVFSADSSKIFYGARFEEVPTIYEGRPDTADDDKVLGRLDDIGSVHRLAVSKNGRWVAAPNSKKSSVEVTVWDRENGKQMLFQKMEYPVEHLNTAFLCFSIDDQLLFVGTGKLINAWSMPTGKVAWTKTITEGEDNLGLYGLMKSGNFLVTKFFYTLQFWDAAGELQYFLRAFADAEKNSPIIFDAVAFNADGTQFVFSVTGDEHPLYLVDLVAMKVKAKLLGCKGLCTAVFTPDGKQIVAVQFDKICVWDVPR